MTIVGEYKLSEDAYPKITIGLDGTSVNHGIHGTYSYSPQEILVEVESLGEIRKVDIDELANLWKAFDERAVEALQSRARSDAAEFCGYMECIKNFLGEETAQKLEKLVYAMEENMYEGKDHE